MAAASAASSVASYKPVSVGSEGTLEFRVFVEKDGKRVSPWHQIPLVANADKKTYHFFCEIPRGTNAKMEIATGEDPHNPIKQDIKNGKLRYVADVNGSKGYFCNYGAFPQTWEDPEHVHPDTGHKGDKDPLDGVEVGEALGKRGELKEVKILGVSAMIDEGETDWKVICIDVNDPLAARVNDIGDLEREKPGINKTIYEWFRDYKIPDGKPPNKFAFDGQPRDRAYALRIIEECHAAWQRKHGAKAQL